MTSTLTPAQAFDQLRERVEYGIPVNHSKYLDYDGRSERFQFDGAVPDQSVAIPRRVPVSAIVEVIIENDGRLILQLMVIWKSIYGPHTSIAEYVITKTGSEVDITPQWRQDLPVTLLENLDVHTGGVSVGDYHQKALDELRASGGPIANMLWNGTERAVDAYELVSIADAILPKTPLL